MNDLLTWAPLIVAAVVGWTGHGIMRIVHAANLDRREDHKEMMGMLADIASDISNLESAVDGLSSRYDPQDLTDYD